MNKTDKLKIDVYEQSIYVRKAPEEVQELILKFIRYNVGRIKWNDRNDWGELELTKLKGLSVNPANVITVEKHKDFKFDFDYFNHYLDDNPLPTMFMDRTIPNRRKVKAFSNHLNKYLLKNDIETFVNYDRDFRSKPAMTRIMDSLHDCWHKSKFIEGDDDIAAINNRYHNENSDINRMDKYNNIIIEGSIKYYRYYDGRVYRGRAYHRLNNQYWLVLNKYDIKYVSAFELFDYDPHVVLRRFRNVSRKYVINKLEKEKNSLLEEMKSKTTDEGVLKLSKLKDRLDFVSEFYEKIDISEFKNYRDNIEAAGCRYYEFNKNDIFRILNAEPGKLENSEYRKLLQLVYPDKMIGSGLFQPILIFNIKSGERIDPPLEAYNNINPLVDKILDAAQNVYDISSVDSGWLELIDG